MRDRAPKSEGPSVAMIAVGGGVAVGALLLCLIAAGLSYLVLRPRPDLDHQAKQPPEPKQAEQPQVIKLTNADLKFSWGREQDTHLLSFHHGQKHALRNVQITVQWVYAGYKSGASQQLNWQLWGVDEHKVQRMAVRGRPTSIRIVGRADGLPGTTYEFDWDIPEPVQDGPPPANIRLTSAQMKFSWAKAGDRHVLSYSHGQAQELRNVQVTVHWFQAAYNVNASQGRNYPLWRPNEFKQQSIVDRDRATNIRITGRADGPGGIGYVIDCLVPDPK